MAKMSMAEEIKFLREEVERLKKEDAQSAPEVTEDDASLDALVEGVHEMEDELEDKVHELVERMKDDYENMSPVTAVAIFAVGALFGRIFLSK
jgi:predicted transcriptional regulator